MLTWMENMMKNSHCMVSIPSDFNVQMHSSIFVPSLHVRIGFEVTEKLARGISYLN